MQFHAFGVSAYFNAESAGVAALGGALLGMTVVFKTLLTGNVLGISCATKGLMKRWRSPDKAAFLLGLVVAGPVMAATYGGFEPMPPPATSETGLLLVRLFLGGLLVGVGTAFGNGCTSGHGLTGLARLSLRSWTAVPLFMISGVCAASVSCAATDLPPDAKAEAEVGRWSHGAAVASGGAVVLFSAAAAASALRGRLEAWKMVPLLEFAGGLTFGVGLTISGMTRPSKVAAFLDLRSGCWDPSLAFVMASALLVTLPFFQVLERLEGRAPLVGASFELPPKSNPVDTPLLVGALLFGVGWGLTGACPGPLWVVLLAVPSLEVTLLWVGMLAGMGVWLAWQAWQAWQQAMAERDVVISLGNDSSAEGSAPARADGAGQTPAILPAQGGSRPGRAIPST